MKTPEARLDILDACVAEINGKIVRRETSGAKNQFYDVTIRLPFDVEAQRAMEAEPVEPDMALTWYRPDDAIGTAAHPQETSQRLGKNVTG